MPSTQPGADVFFLLVGAVLVFSMHCGFAFLEVGTVQRKNQVNALVKIIAAFATSTVAYLLIGFTVAYGLDFFSSARVLSGGVEGSPFGLSGYDLVKFFFLATFAAAIPAIISGGIAERARFWPQLFAGAVIVAIVYPTFEGMVWGDRHGYQSWIRQIFGAEFHDFAGSVVVHAMGGWIALGAVITLGPRLGRYPKSGGIRGIKPSSIPFLALGSWILCMGWFGFNVMSSKSLGGASGLVAMNSLMALAGGTLAALAAGRNDPGFVHNGALAGLVAVCAGSDIMHPFGALTVGAVAGLLFVYTFKLCQIRWKIDDVLGVWPLHGLCGAWGGLAVGIFGQEWAGGLGGVTIAAQAAGTITGILFGLGCGFAIYTLLKVTVGIRMSKEAEFVGADLSIHNITASSD